MEKWLAFFEHIPSMYRAVLLVGGLVFFWIVEGIIPLVRMSYAKVRHAGLNLFFTFTTILVNFLFAIAIVWVSDWSTQRGWGLLNWIAMPVWLMVCVGLLLLDLISAYLIHWLTHQVRWMWKFHLVHHTDTYIDTTTANRHHPGESVFRASFTLLAVFVTGAPIGLVMLYQSLSVLFSQFNHANIRLPKWLDRTLSWVIVSPDMHKIHHHYTQPLTDTNYGNIFSIWDRMFGTFASVPDRTLIRYGIDTHLKESEHNRMGNLLQIPFQPYRQPTSFSSARFEYKPSNMQ